LTTELSILKIYFESG